MTVPVIEDYTEQTETNPTTSIDVSKPSGVQNGELMLVIIMNDRASSTASFVEKSGWTLEFEVGNTNSDCHIGVYWKIADGSEQSTETFTQNYTDEWVAWWLRISGIDTENPINIVGTERIASGTSLSAYSVTTDVDDCLAFVLGSMDGGDGYPFTVSGSDFSKWRELQSGTSGYSDACGVVGTKEMPTQGATGDTIISHSSSNDGMVTIQMAIASGGAAETPVFIQDGLGLSDNIGKERRFSISDNVGASDGFPLTDRTFTLADVLDLLDSILKQRNVPNISDTVDLTDIISKQRTVSSILDALALSDSIIRDKTVLIIQDAANLSDAISLLKNLGIIDTLNLGDDVIVTYGPTVIQVSDVLTLLDVILKERRLSIQDTENLVDAIFKERGLDTQDIINLSDAVLKERQLNTLDTYGLTDTIFKERTLSPIEDSVNITDIIALLKTLGITDSLNLNDDIIVDFGATEIQIFDTISLTDTQLTDKSTLIVIDATSLLDSILNDKAFTINDQIEILDTIKQHSGIGWHHKIYGISDFKDILGIPKEHIKKINKVD